MNIRLMFEASTFLLAYPYSFGIGICWISDSNFAIGSYQAWSGAISSHREYFQ
jgi:hypothetical protein